MTHTAEFRRRSDGSIIALFDTQKPDIAWVCQWVEEEGGYLDSYCKPYLEMVNTSSLATETEYANLKAQIEAEYPKMTIEVKP